MAKVDFYMIFFNFQKNREHDVPHTCLVYKELRTKYSGNFD